MGRNLENGSIPAPLSEGLNSAGRRRLVGRTKSIRRRTGEPASPRIIDTDELKKLIVLQTEDIPWRFASPEALSEVIEMVARQAEVPVSLLNKPDFMTPIDELGGSDLIKLYIYGKRLLAQHNRGKTAIGELFERAEIRTSVEDLKQAKELNRTIQWNQIQPETIREVILLVAEELQKTVWQLTPADFKHNFQTLNGMSLEGLRSRFRKRIGPRRREKDTMPEFLAEIGLSAA